jgi:hypothetical protein
MRMAFSDFSFFQWVVVSEIGIGIFVLAIGIQAIYRILEEILDELKGEAKKIRDEADFWYRGDKNKESQ